MKKLVSLFLALALLLGMMSFAAAEEPFEISVLLPEFPADIDFVMEDNPVLAKIQELSGVKLNIQWGPNSTYGDILNTTLADQNPPMLIAAPARTAAISTQTYLYAFTPNPRPCAISSPSFNTSIEGAVISAVTIAIRISGKAKITI